MRRYRYSSAIASSAYRSRGSSAGHGEQRLAAARRRMPDQHSVERVCRELRALGEPNRLRIAVALLTAGELAVGELASVVGLSEPATSRHLRILRAERLVRARRQGQFVLCSLADEHVTGYVRLTLEHAAHD